MAMNSSMYGRLCDLYGRVLLRMRQANSELGRFFEAHRQSADLVQLEQMEPRLLLSASVGHHLFYNDSAFDDNNAAINVADDAAIAPDKTALRELGQATFANYSSYDKGINGIMVDVDKLPKTPTLSDFIFRTGTNDHDLSSWQFAPNPTGLKVRKGAGVGGSDRIVLTWDDASAVKNAWLQVTVLSTPNTGLYEQDVFYFGSAIGETGNAAGSTRVNATDMLLVRRNTRSLLDPAGIDDPYDFNRDAKVDASDMLIARRNQTNFATDLPLVSAPLNPVDNLRAEVYSASEVRLSWQDRSESELGYRVLMASSESGPFSEIATTGPNATAALLTELPAGVSRWFRVEPIGPAGASVAADNQAPAIRVDLPERLAGVGVNDKHFKIKITGSLTRGEAGYTGEGSARLLGQGTEGGYAVAVAESAEAAVWSVVRGSATITDHENNTRDYIIDSSGAYKVGTVSDLDSEIGDNGCQGFQLDDAGYGLDSDQWLLVLEDTYEWQQSSWGNDEDYDDFYWTLDVEPIVDLVVNDVVGEADDVIEVVADPENYVPIVAYVPWEIYDGGATQARLTVADGSWPEDVVLYDSNKDEIKIGDASWSLNSVGDTVKQFYLKAVVPFATTQLVLTAGDSSDAEWVHAGCQCDCSGERPGGNATASAGSLEFSFDLGSVDNGDSGGFVTLYSDRGTGELDTPRALHLTAHSSVTVNDSALDSSAGDGEVLWLTLNASGAESKVYVDVHSSEEGGGYSLIFKTVSGQTETAFRRIKFQDDESPTGDHDYEITISRYEISNGGATETQNGYWLCKWTAGEDEAPGTWEITTGSSSTNLHRVETHVAEYDDTYDTIRIETTTLSDPDTEDVVSHVVEKYKKFDWGEELIERTVYAGYDSGSQSYTGGQTTTWEYHTSGANNAGKLKLSKDALGHWTYYKTYGARGYATEVIEQYGDNTFNEQSGTLASDNVTTTYAEYRQWSSSDDDRITISLGGENETLDLVTRTVVTPPSSAGDPVYSYRITRALADSTLAGYVESWDVEATTGDPENGYGSLAAFIEDVMDGDFTDCRIWKSWRYPANSTGTNEQYAGRLKKSIGPDGVVTIYDYDHANGKTTVQTGLPDSGGSIVEGSKTVTTVNDTGRTTQQERYERKRENSGWILTSLVKYSDFDAYGRSGTATYWFGEEAEDELASAGSGTAAYSTTTTYTCCKIDEFTGRDGVTTDYDHDSLGRVVKVATEIEDGGNEEYLYTQRYAYDAAGRQVESRLDVDHDGWDTTLDDDIVTSKTSYDLAGRVIQTEDAEGSKTFYTYRILDIDFDPTAGEDIRTIQESRAYGHDADSGPIHVTWTDTQGRMIRSFTAKLASGEADWNGSAPTGEEALDELSRTVYQYDWRGRQTAVRAYHDLTAGSIALSGAGTTGSAYTWGEGSSGTNYYQSTTTYAHSGEVQYTTDPAGDISFYVYDDAGRHIQTWAGTALGSAWTATAPNAGTGGNMTKVSEIFYDDDHDRDGSEYDWRMSPTRQTGLKPLTTLAGTSADYTYVDYSSVLDYTDNGDADDDFRIEWSKPALGAWSKQVYSIEGDLLESLTYDHTGSTLGNLLAKVTYQYDSDTGWLDSGRVYEVSSGSAGDYLQTTYTYDDFGRQVKIAQAGGGYTKVVFDDLGRVEREVYAASEGNDTDVIDSQTGEVDFTDDVVLTETVYEYDDVGNVLLTTVYQRAADATATGLLSNASASQSRVSYSAAWYDDAHRVTHLADYGTNGGTAIADIATGDFDPDTAGTQHYADFTPQPNGSDLIIVTKYEYNDSGRAYKVTANDGAATVTEYDALGRTTATIQNYDDGSPGGDSGETDVDLVTRYTFDTSGRLKEQTADLPGTSDDQVTRYFYSGEFDADHDGTVVKSNSMLRATRYPDSTLTDQNVIDILDEAQGAPESHDFVAVTYNAAGLVATTSDQREVVHTYDYDAIGRLLEDAVTLPQGSDVDDSILAITTSYDALGRVAKITSHSDADPDTTSFTDAVNQVEYAYDGWGNLATEKQEHDGAVDGNTLSVQYTYDDGASGGVASHLRLAKITYPDGLEVYYNYASGIAADISRVSEIADDDLDNGSRTQYATYDYLGAGVIVNVAHPAVSGGLTLDYGADGSDGWDNFGRVTDQTWTNTAGTTTFDDFAYTYDRASNRVTRDLSLTTGLDEKYTYDGLNRLANTERGTLSSGSITNLAFEQDFTLDELGNWDEFKQDDDGNGSWDIDQDRTHNDANEITDLSGSWTDPSHDAAGNMTLATRPGDEADANDALILVYDAWNRLAKVYDDNDADGQPDAGELLATYEYDGQRRRIVETIEGSPDVARDSYYSDAWQVVEVRKDGDGDPLKQFIWDQRYVDSPVVRFHDGDTDGTIDDTLYYATDANFNVTALLNASGSVVERYTYDPYGAVTVLDGTTGGQTDWAADADGVSDVDNRVLYAGYHFDSETGLYHVRNRDYHPTLGRWMQRDSIQDGMNPYEYVGSNTVGMVDPSGLFGQDVHEDLTYVLALAAGACPDEALGMAVSDQRQDNWLYGAPENRLLRGLEWYQQTLVDIWHMPGAGWDVAGAGLGVGSTVRPGSNHTNAVLNMLRQAAFQGGRISTTFEGYSRARLPGTHLQIGWTETEAASYFMSTRWGVPFLSNRTTIDIVVYDQIAMMGVYLHSLQDSHGHVGGSFGHGNIPATGSTIVNNITDLADRNRRSMAAAQETYEAITDFLRQNPRFGWQRGPRLTWGQVSGLVDQFTQIAAIPSNSPAQAQRATRQRKQQAYQAFISALRTADPSLPTDLKDYSGYVPLETHYLGQLGDDIARQIQQPQAP